MKNKNKLTTLLKIEYLFIIRNILMKFIIKYWDNDIFRSASCLPWCRQCRYRYTDNAKFEEITRLLTLTVTLFVWYALAWCFFNPSISLTCINHVVVFFFADRFLRNWRSHDEDADNIILQLEQPEVTNGQWPPRISFT